MPSPLDKKHSCSGAASGASVGGGFILGLAEVGVGVAQLREIARARFGVELGEERVIERRGLARSHFACRIVELAERDCLRRACRLARADQLGVTGAAVLRVV